MNISLKKMKERRDELGYSTDKVANFASIKPDTYRRYEKGTRIPPIDVLCNIADTLQCDIDYLIGKIPQSTHELTDIHRQTGLSEHAINDLKQYHDNQNTLHLLNWLIEHGLLAVLEQSYDRLIELQKIKTQYDNLPSDIKLIALGGYDPLKSYENTYLFNWLQSQSSTHIENLYNRMINNCIAEYDGDSAEWYLDYCIENDMSETARNSKLRKIYSATTKIIHNWWTLEKQDKTFMFEIWDSYLDLIKQYRKDDSFNQNFKTIYDGIKGTK